MPSLGGAATRDHHVDLQGPTRFTSGVDRVLLSIDMAGSKKFRARVLEWMVPSGEPAASNPGHLGESAELSNPGCRF